MRLKWQYYVALCYCKTIKKGSLFSKAEQQWVISLDKEMELSEGLQYMGEKGWELVGIQKLADNHGGQISTWDYVTCYYIFKTSKW